MKTEGWLSKKQVEEILICSGKTVDRYCEQGKIQRAYPRIPGRTGRPKPVYHPGDVEKMRQELVEIQTQPVPESPLEGDKGPGKSLVPTTTPVDPEGFWRALSGPQVKVSEKLYLSLDEASSYSGLTKAFLKRAIQEGRLNALMDGGYKIKRSELERL